MSTKANDKFQGTKVVMKIHKSKIIQWPEIKGTKAKGQTRKLSKSKISNTYESSLKIRIAFID